MNSNLITVNDISYTNVFNLPEEIIAALTVDRYNPSEENLGDYSATTLINPIQMTVLKKRHKDNLIVRDITSQTWTMFGSLAHACIEDQCIKLGTGMVEQRLYATVNDKVVSGKMDRYVDGEVKDWKFTKTYKWMRNDFLEWEQQLNILAYLLTTNGYPVNKLSIVMHLRDFNKNDTYKKGYPDCEWQVVNINLWSTMDQESYITERLALLTESSKLTDSEIALQYPCSDRSMWRETLDWACLKEGATKATRKFDTKEEAEEYAKGKDLKVVERKSSRRRCLSFCDCSNICFQNAALLKEEGVSEESDEETIF